MERTQKILLGTFIILLGFFVFELLYYLFPQAIPNVSQFIPRTPTSSPLIAESQEKEKLLSLIPKAKSANWSNAVNAIDYLKKTPIEKKCSFSSSCLILNNIGSTWWGDSSSSATLINSPFVVKVSLQNKDGLGGIVLYGRITEKPPWWKDIKSIFIGTSIEGKRLYSDSKNGTSEKPYLILDKFLNKPLNTLYIFFNQDGKNLIITDEAYETLAYLDVNRLTNNAFPNGLFPDKKLYVGFAVAPYTNALISDFSILSLVE